MKDKYVELEKKGQAVPFKHSWAMLSHMHDLRLWTIAYSPSKINNLQRLQELHRINNEALYLIQSSLWKRIILGFFIGLHRAIIIGSFIVDSSHVIKIKPLCHD